MRRTTRRLTAALLLTLTLALGAAVAAHLPDPGSDGTALDGLLRQGPWNPDLYRLPW